jgi:homoaconitate hydratase
MTPEMMARVAFENYDPQLAERLREGDVVVGGDNFGTGSSREQAVTALQARGLPLVVAGSYSQTYLRNAFNNGFPCIECPDLLARLRELFAEELRQKTRSIVPGDPIEVDFRTGRLAYRGQTFAFPALGRVPQALVVARGVENQVRLALGLGAP